VSFRSLPPGSLVERAYFSVPQHHTTGYTTPGNSQDDWDAAVVHAQGRRGQLIAQLTESLNGFGTEAEIAATADAQIRVDLRWFVRRPDGSAVEMTVETFQPVTELRTYASFTAAGF